MGDSEYFLIVGLLWLILANQCEGWIASGFYVLAIVAMVLSILT